MHRFLGRKAIRVKAVLHSSTTDCGIACLQMVLSSHGIRADLADVRSVIRYSAGGVTVGNIVRAAKTFGFDGRAVRVEVENLNRLQLPAIIHWNFNHFVVVESIGQRSVSIIDPALGRRSVKLGELSRSFTGIAIEFEPSSTRPETQPSASPWSARRFLPSMAGGSALLAAAGVALSILAQLLLVLAPIWMASLIENVSTPGLTAALPEFMGIVALLVVAAGIADVVQRAILLRLGTMASISSSAKLVDHLFALSYAFFGSRRINDMISRVGHIRNIRDIVVENGIPAAIDLMFSLVALTVLFVLSPIFGFVCAGMLAVYGAFRMRMFARTEQLTQELVSADSNEMGHLMENLRNVLTLKAANVEVERISIWQSALQRAGNASVRLRQAQSMLTASRFGASYVDQLGVVAIGVFLVANGRLSFGALLAVLLIRQQLNDRALTFMDRATNLALLKMYVYRLSDIMSAKASLTWSSKEPAWVSEAGMLPLSIDAVSYKYAEEAPLAVENATLSIEAGALIGIHGCSGDGKSTLMKLALGLLEPVSGCVRAGDNVLDEAGWRALRDRSGVVLQGEQLFSGTVMENITLFGHDRDMEAVVASAKAACIHEEIVRLPMGYHTVVNDGISNFSGGQVQRILLARALYRQPQFLFLDEATSALDPALERKILQHLRAHPSAKLCIAHRGLLLDEADQIYRMEGGRLILEEDRRSNASRRYAVAEASVTRAAAN